MPIQDFKLCRIATVTLNPTVDKTMIVPGFAVGRTNRAQIAQIDPGGKGINVAKAAQKLGAEVVATGFLAGRHGAAIAEALTARGITADFVFVPGETRTNLKIRDPLSGSETEINEPGFPVTAEFLPRLEAKIAEHAQRCQVVTFSGSLPPETPNNIYARLIRVAKENGARTVLDTGGEALRLGMSVPPDLIKPNRAEVEELLDVCIKDDQELAAAARRLLALGPATVVVSLGARGALLATRHHIWLAHAPRIKPRSSIGSGDAMVAILALALVNQVPPAESLRLATAAGTASAALEGTEVAGPKEIKALLPAVAVEAMM